MSYRELRDFNEHMKTLGYPSALSIDSFRQPNFPLVASLLLFLLHRYDPTLVPPEDISTQSARIGFIQVVTALLLSKCHIKLSMKQLYKADGYAVKELLKLSTTLYTAMQTSSSSSSSSPSSALSTSPTTSSHPSTSSPSSTSSTSSPLTPSFDVFKDAKSLAAELIDLGERLSTLLSHEPTVRPARDSALFFVDSLSTDDGRGGATVERSIRRQMALMQDNLTELKASQGQLSEDLDKVRGKVERKEGERERLDKRWKALRRVKPQFIEEFEREEKELRTVYAAYVERLRNVQWLEGEMKELRREEEEEKKESERRLTNMQKRLREEEINILRGNQALDDTDEDEEEEEEEEEGEEEGEEEEGEEDEKRGIGGGYERKEGGRRGDEEDEEEEGEEEEEDDEDEEKRPSRGRGATGRGGGDRSVIRGRGSASTGRKKGTSLSGEDAELLSESDTSGLGEDEYF